MNKKGFFILFEGPDRSGKSTQVNLLSDYLKKKNVNVIVTREPGGTLVGEDIRNILLNPNNKISPLCEVLLYEAARAQHVQEKIKPALENDYVVICDRFTLATEAYQGYGRGIDINIVKTLNNIATGGLKPDLIICLTISDEEYKKRRRSQTDRMESESDEFRIRVNNAYFKIFSELKEALIIDSSKTIEEIHSIIVKEVECRLKI